MVAVPLRSFPETERVESSDVALHAERAWLRLLLAAGKRRPDEASVEGESLVRALARTERALARVADAATPSRGQALVRALGLTDDEEDFFWTAVALATDPRVAPCAHVLWGADARRGLPLALHALAARLDPDRAQRLSGALAVPSHPLRRHRLLLPASDDVVHACLPFAAAPRVVAHLLGNDGVDAALAGHTGCVVAPEPAPLDADQRAAVDLIAQALQAGCAVHVHGAEGAGRRTAAAIAARRLGLCVFALDAPRLPAAAQGAAFDALRRELCLRDAIPLVADVDATRGEEAAAQAGLVADLLDEVTGPALVTARGAGAEVLARRDVVRVHFPSPDGGARHELWTAVLGEAAPHALDEIAHRFRVGPGSIRRAAAAARLHARTRDGVLAPGDLHAGVRACTGDRLAGLAQRIEPRHSWDDLILPDDTLEELRALAARGRHARTVYERWGLARGAARGTGAAALFSGPPGTGKTLAAGVIAREMGVDLYLVDLAQVMSKWVGETEKQLARIFDAAEDGHALLLFDEADALFGKRSASADSGAERHANLEVGFLLSRIESFGGMAILTTNLERAIDPALKRRLAAHIVFWKPELDERVALWRANLRQAPCAEPIDVSALARRYADMSGANIRNAALSAAFLAADEGVPIRQLHLERAAATEHRAMGRIVRAAT